MTDLLCPPKTGSSAAFSSLKPRPPTSPCTSSSSGRRQASSSTRNSSSIPSSPSSSLLLNINNNNIHKTSSSNFTNRLNSKQQLLIPSPSSNDSRRTSISHFPSSPHSSNNQTRKIRLNIDLKQVQPQNETTTTLTIIPKRPMSQSLTSSPINRHPISPNSYFTSPVSNSSVVDLENTPPITMITITSSYKSTVDKNDLMKIVPYSPHIPSPIMSKGLFEGDGSDFSPREAHWMSKQKKVLTKEKSVQLITALEEENELSLMSPRHIVETYSTTKKKFNEIKSNPIFDTALLENKSKVAEYKSQKFKILREFCDMNSTLDVCYKELGSFTSLENPQDPLKVVVDKAAFEQSPIHDHEDALHKRRQLKRMMKSAKNQNIANDYASDMDLKSLLLICDLREKEKKEFPTPRKSHLKSPRTPRTPGRNAKLPPLKFSEQFRLAKMRQSLEETSPTEVSPLQSPKPTAILSPTSSHTTTTTTTTTGM